MFNQTNVILKLAVSHSTSITLYYLKEKEILIFTQ